MLFLPTMKGAKRQIPAMTSSSKCQFKISNRDILSAVSYYILYDIIHLKKITCINDKL